MEIDLIAIGWSKAEVQEITNFETIIEAHLKASEDNLVFISSENFAGMTLNIEREILYRYHRRGWKVAITDDGWEIGMWHTIRPPRVRT